MILTQEEIRAIQEEHGLYITEKCDGCGKALNQSVRNTIAGKPEVYCSATCRDFAFFVNRREARKRAAPGKCLLCGATLNGRRRDALYCDDACKKRAIRTNGSLTTGKAEIAGTPAQWNQ